MKYEGKLYAKIGGMYIDTGKTSKDWDSLDQQNKALKDLLNLALAYVEADKVFPNPDLIEKIKQEINS